MMNYDCLDLPWASKAKIRELLLNVEDTLKVEIMYICGDLFEGEVSGEYFWFGDHEHRVELTGTAASTFLSSLIAASTQNQLMTLLENTVIANDESVSEGE